MKRRLAVAVGALALAWAARAEVQAKEPPVSPEIRVVAAPAGVFAPTSTAVDREALVRAKKLELSDMLDLTPGLNVRVGGRGEPRVDLRGFDQRSTLILLDGVPVTDPWNGIVNVNLFPIEMVGVARITRGPVSSLLGPNALAGAIELNTRRPAPGVSADLGTQWRDSKTWDVRGAASYGAGPGAAIVGGRYVTSSGFPLSASFDDRPATRRRWEDGGLRLNSDREQWSGFGSGRYAFSPDGSARLAVLASDAQFGIPPTTTAFLPPFRRIDDQRLLLVQGGVDYDFDRSDVSTAVFYDRYDSRESNFEGPQYQRAILSTKVAADEVGGLVRAHWDAGEHVRVGGSAQLRRAGARVTDTASGLLNDSNLTTTSLGLEGEILPWPWLSLVLGLSGDIQSGGGGGTQGNPNPLGALSADLGEYGSASVLVGRRTRFPTLRELFDPLQGNADLSAERALTYQLSYRYTAPVGFAQVAVFRSNVDDLIEQAGSSDRTRFVNLRNAVLQGVETVLGAQPVDWLELSLNYTYLDARARNERTGQFTRIQHRPENRMNGVLSLFFPWAFLLRLEGLYGSAQLDQFGGSITTGAFGLFNGQLAWSGITGVTLYAGCDNLLDQDYEQRLGTPQPGRWVYLGFRASYTEGWRI